VIKRVKQRDGCLVKWVLKEMNKNWSDPKTKTKTQRKHFIMVSVCIYTELKLCILWLAETTSACLAFFSEGHIAHKIAFA
jgi:hypothetical protein